MNRGHRATPASWWRRHGELLASALLLLVYVGALSCMPTQVFWHPDEGAKFLSMRALRWDHGLAYQVPYPGRVLDPTLEFYAGRCRGGEVYPLPQLDGSVRFRWPIWFPLASWPFFDVFGVAGVYVLPLLCGWLSAVVAGRWMTLAGSQLAPLAILLIGSGTPLLFYSLGFFEHTLATFAGVVATSLLVSSHTRRWRTLLQVAPFLLVAIALRVEMVAFAAALGLAWVIAWAALRVDSPHRDSPAPWLGGEWSSFVIGAGVAGLVVVILAGLLNPRQLQQVLDLWTVGRQSMDKWPYAISGTVRLLIGPLDLGPISGAAWQLLLVVSIVAAGVAPFVPSRRAEAILILAALVVLTAPSLMTAFVSRPFLGRQGVLAVAPYMVIGMYVVPHAWRQHNRALLCLACTAIIYAVLGYLALFGARVNASGDELIGLDGCARYMLTLYPMGVVLSLVATQTVRASDRSDPTKSAFTILVAVMFIVSCAYEFRSLREMRANKLALVAWEDALRSGDRVVTDVWWLPAVLAPLATTHEMYCIDKASAFPEFLARARAHGAKSFSFCTPRDADEPLVASTAGGLVHGAGREVAGLHIYPLHFGDGGEVP